MGLAIAYARRRSDKCNTAPGEYPPGAVQSTMYSDQLRHRRRITAEKRAATASTRMLIPLVLFIFPTLFVVLLGPALMRISSVF